MGKVLVVVRGAALVLAVVVPTRWLWGVAADTWSDAARRVPMRPGEALTGVVACAALAVLAALALAVVVELLGQAPGVVGASARRVGAVVTPGLVRRAVGVALGVAVVAAGTPGAAAARPRVMVLAPTTASAPPPDPAFAPLPDPGWAPPETLSTQHGAGWVPSPPVVR
ncbi:MAG: hypothetical protein ACJ710_08430, partial [Ornithinibacter sp.]